MTFTNLHRLLKAIQFQKTLYDEIQNGNESFHFPFSLTTYRQQFFTLKTIGTKYREKRPL